MRKLGSALALVLIGAVAHTEARGDIIRTYEFDVDGALPSVEPDIQLFTAGATASEAQVYSVSGGVLRQSSQAVTGNYSYSFPDATLTGGGIVAGVSLIMEARLRILSIQGVDGAFFAAFNGTHRYGLHFEDTGTAYLGAQGSGTAIALSDIGSFHTYRVEAPLGGSQMTVSIDGSVVFSGAAPGQGGYNGFEWGDGFSAAGNGANVEWDFVRFYQPAEASAAVSAPPTSMLFAIFVPALFLLRRMAIR